MLVHPQYDPIAIQLGPLAVRWYGLMYLVGFGLIWLAGFVGGAKEAIQFGLAPFWIGDILKLALAAVLLPSAWKLIRRAL